MSTLRSIALVLVHVLAVGTGAAQTISTFTITDGNCTYRLSNLIGHRLDAGGGVAGLVMGPANYVDQNWFWYRTSTDSREYALSRQVVGTAAGNQARLVYLEPLFDGQVPDALLVDLQYTISDMSGSAPPACRHCELVIAVKVRNLQMDAPYSVDFFAYNDMGLNSMPTTDSASIAGSANHIQLVFDPGLQNLCPASGIFKVSSTALAAWEIDQMPNIVSKLSDNVPSNLSNSVSPFGPGDYSGAQQWRFVLGPPGSLDDEWIGSVVKEVAYHTPGDIDGNCTVDLNDLTLLLSSFGRICP